MEAQRQATKAQTEDRKRKLNSPQAITSQSQNPSKTAKIQDTQTSQPIQRFIILKPTNTAANWTTYQVSKLLKSAIPNIPISNIWKTGSGFTLVQSTSAINMLYNIKDKLPQEFNKSFAITMPPSFRQFSTPAAQLILKGVNTDITEQEITQDLREQGYHSIISTKRFTKSTANGPIPIPVVSIRLSNLGHANQLLNHGLTIGYTRVRVEKPHNTGEIPTRCYKCQKYGHTAIRCQESPVCAICANKDCPAIGNRDTRCTNDTKCANCNGPHPTFARSCPAYKQQAVKATEIAKTRTAKQTKIMESITERQQQQTSLTYSQAVNSRINENKFVTELAESVVRFTCDLANKIIKAAPSIDQQTKDNFKTEIEKWSTILANHYLKIKLSPASFQQDEQITNQSSYITDIFNSKSAEDPQSYQPAQDQMTF